MSPLPVVRDYVLYDNRIHDRRTNETTRDVRRFLDGGIDTFLRELIVYRGQRR